MAAGRIYVGGGFTSTRPSGAAAGTAESDQGYLAAFDADTGEQVASFDPVLSNDYTNGPATVHAMALSPDGGTLAVGGDFNLIDGVRAEHVALFDTATGAFIEQVGYNGVNGTVRALAFSPDGATLYVGGIFNQANWSPRDRLAAFDLATGELLDWAPVMSGGIANEALRASALAVSADGGRVFVGGTFRQMNGETRQGVAAVDADTGANVAGFRSDYLLAPYNWATTLEVAGDTLYLAGRDDASGSAERREGVYAIDAAGGEVEWYSRCYGDSFDILVAGDEVYVASHAHGCSQAGGWPETNPRKYVALHVLDRATGQVEPGFEVLTSGSTSDPDSLLMSRALASDGEHLVMGGGYQWVRGSGQATGQQQSNLVRFALR